MKSCFSLYIILLSVNISRADFVAKDFITLTLTAEKIASGEIVCVDDKVFVLKVGNSLFPDDKLLTIRKFEDWTCAVRWSEYYVGQSIMVFLSSDEEGFYSMGAGNEGELPVSQGKVYINSMSLPFSLDDYKFLTARPQYKKYDAESYQGYEMDLILLWDYVKNIRDCLDFELNGFERVKSATLTCPPQKAKVLSKKHKLYQWTFEKLLTNADTAYH